MEIMQAAERLFTSRRFHEVTLDDVARQARVGKGTIYRYFRDKDDLFFRTAMNGFEELCDVLRTAAPDEAPFRTQLLGACERVSAFFRGRRPLLRMMHGEESRLHWCRGQLRRQWTAHREKLASAVAEVLRRGAQEGAVRTDVSPRVLAGVLLGILRMQARELAESLGERRSLQLAVTLFLEGAARAAPRGRGARPAAAGAGGAR